MEINEKNVDDFYSDCLLKHVEQPYNLIRDIVGVLKITDTKITENDLLFNLDEAMIDFLNNPYFNNYMKPNTFLEHNYDEKDYEKQTFIFYNIKEFNKFKMHNQLAEYIERKAKMHVDSQRLLARNPYRTSEKVDICQKLGSRVSGLAILKNIDQLIRTDHKSKK